MSGAVLWLRRDLRRADHPALAAAGEAGEVTPLFVLDPGMWERAGAVRQAWVAASVLAADEAYEGRLCIRAGRPEDVVPAVVGEVGAGSVHFSRETTPAGARRDAVVANRLRRRGIASVATGSPYAVDPGTVRTGAGRPYRVFTPFSRAWRDHGWPPPEVEPRRITWRTAESDPDARRLLVDAVAGSPISLPPAGEAAAHERWRFFLASRIAAYAEDRDRPDLDASSRLSPYLKVGAIHPRTVLAQLGGWPGRGRERFVTELAWREFYADILWQHPSSASRDLRADLAGMAYEPVDGVVAEQVSAWRAGRTGYPFVDAGMRQLLGEGWMHNRVRMVTASFLVKDLHVWWPVGARHFLDHLIDGDVASNSHGWQWVSGTGTDAAPYFRIFNPVTQGKRFDPGGDYVRRYVPELAHLPGAAVHEPWTHPEGYAAGYPTRIVDHEEERRDALARYAAARA